MKPTWWQLYGLGVLLVALVGAIEAVSRQGLCAPSSKARRSSSASVSCWSGAVTIGSRWSWRHRLHIQAVHGL